MQKPPDKHLLRRVLFSLSTSILVTFAAIFALNSFLGYTGIINIGGSSTTGITAITVVWTLFAVFLYSIFSVGMLQNSAQRTIANVARNSFVALAAGLLFIILSDVSYGTQFNFFGNTWRFFYSSLVSGFPGGTFDAFVAISVFSLDYARRQQSSQPPKAPMVKTI